MDSIRASGSSRCKAARYLRRDRGMSRTVVVTGGTTGIGHRVAREFAEAGDTVVITGRSAERLRQAAEELPATDESTRRVIASVITERVDSMPRTAYRRGSSAPFLQVRPTRRSRARIACRTFVIVDDEGKRC
ncbi:SDR family NAD(P)-dependent oxidoreductase [Nocardia sp. NPDC004568]|uniref:SDR family NAD(P)-dependent oxidoreductase n=1 Tax=Nocardia sp. NPDC004568 TaxID=3154551 RepID=UPI0033ADB065